MARGVRAAKLETRTSHLKLPVTKKPVFVRVAPGLSLGYRRNQTAGTWVVRVADGGGGAWTKSVGIADDLADSDGHSVLNLWEAQSPAKATGQAGDGTAHRQAALTASVAAEGYLSSLEARNGRTANDARLRLSACFCRASAIASCPT